MTIRKVNTMACLKVLRRGTGTYSKGHTGVVHLTVILEPDGTMKKLLKAESPH